jgi:hypothetical protein
LAPASEGVRVWKLNKFCTTQSCKSMEMTIDWQPVTKL